MSLVPLGDALESSSATAVQTHSTRETCPADGTTASEHPVAQAAHDGNDEPAILVGHDTSGER